MRGHRSFLLEGSSVVVFSFRRELNRDRPCRSWNEPDVPRTSEISLWLQLDELFRLPRGNGFSYRSRRSTDY